jgi:hypothetical protein
MGVGVENGGSRHAASYGCETCHTIHKTGKEVNGNSISS